jgi:ketosteroid isomerase-like protein
MSRENVEITARVCRAYDAYSRGDFDAAMEWVHPEIELVPAGGQPPIRGTADYRAWMEPDAFEFQVVKPLEIRLARDKVLVHQRSTIRGAGSGIETDFLTWSVLTLDDEERTRRIEIYHEHEKPKALAAVGLSE